MEHCKEAEEALIKRKRSKKNSLNGPPQKKVKAVTEKQPSDDPKPDQRPSSKTKQDIGATSNLKRFSGGKIIGKGSFGQVVKVMDNVMKKFMAVKVVPIPTSAMAQKRLYLEKEILQLAAGCPFLIHSHLSFQTKKQWYFAMDLASGGDLHTYVKKQGRLTIASATFYAAEITAGLQFLHRNGYIHRDLKPANILIASSGHVKIADFGLAYKKTEGISGNGGTPGYMAPEVVAGHTYNLAANWSSFGVVVFQLTTGLHSSRCDISALPQDLSIDTQDIIKELLCKDPTKRLGLNGCIRSHPFYRSIDWNELEQLRITPPYIPGEPTNSSCSRSQSRKPPF